MTSAKAKGQLVVRVESVIPRRNVLQEVAGLLAIVLQALANAACVRILLQSTTYRIDCCGNSNWAPKFRSINLDFYESKDNYNLLCRLFFPVHLKLDR